MKNLVPLSRLLALSLLASPVFSAGGGNEICVSDEIPLATTEWTNSFVFPKFDRTQGFLQSIHLTFSGHVEGSARVESLDALPVNVDIMYGAIITLKDPNGNQLMQLTPSTNFNDVLTAFDGTIDFGGTSGVSHDGIVLDESDRAVAPPAALNLADFIGAGNVQMEVIASGNSSAAGSGNVISQFLTSASASITVCYAFIPDCNGNGIADDIDVGPQGTSSDCDQNGVPDECQPDCDKDGIPDECEPDLDNNGIPDDCDLAPDIDLGCAEFNRYELLTPNDTLTLITTVHNPQHAQGYTTVSATRNNKDIGFDHLIGQTFVISGIDILEYSINAIDYRAAVGAGAATDLDGDGNRDLNGQEYEMTPAELQIPRFMGASEMAYGGNGFINHVHPELILIGLSGGPRFSTIVDFLIYNDNEEVFSSEYSFDCWTKVRLLDITNTFSNDFLANSSGDDPTESLGPIETGWFRMRGSEASSTSLTIDNPAIYGVYIEMLNNYGSADLPFERGVQAGHILPRGVNGDNEELAGTDPAPNYGTSLRRRNPASLLLFPEFDNRAGDVTVFSLTNTSFSEEITAHYVYYGKYGQP